MHKEVTWNKTFMLPGTLLLSSVLNFLSNIYAYLSTIYDYITGKTTHDFLLVVFSRFDGILKGKALISSFFPNTIQYINNKNTTHHQQ